ncbi:MAG: gluconate 2-dehydrogenase subunit 3 family protein [Cyanobacteria bacterium NC_groundwater_1444_Ag_S-0.65um_54_12]|nr:gluconate 2-dehydrogenase subunit 3 family protein [Cyanobacteria bacterium NC_groundwater_1444_Ag_S-0.65um_54_12]
MAETLSRRTILKGMGSATLYLLSGTLPLAGCHRAKPAITTANSALATTELLTLERVIERIVPGNSTAPSGNALGVAKAFANLLPSLDTRLQEQFHQLLAIFEGVPLLAGSLTPFTEQSPSGADNYLRCWEQGWLDLQRQGFQGLRRLAVGIYYADPSSWQAIGYPGPWIGQRDVGYGLDNQQELPLLNPNVYASFR